MIHAAIGIGSCGPEADIFLTKAMRRLERHHGWRSVCTSSVYRNPAWGTALPHDFRNGAILVCTQLRPAAILRCLLAIEKELGRVRSIHYGKRSIDLDLLWMNTQPVTTSFVTVPHPRLLQRAFALVPLIEVLERARIAIPYAYQRAAAHLRSDERLVPVSHPPAAQRNSRGAAEQR